MQKILPDYVERVFFSSNGDIVLCLSGNGTHWWKLNTGTVFIFLSQFPIHFYTLGEELQTILEYNAGDANNSRQYVIDENGWLLGQSLRVWLPQDLRDCKMAFKKDMLGIGTAVGRIVLIQLQ